MHDFPPHGAYAVADPYRPDTVSYWILRGYGLEAWPTGAGSKYGPPKPAPAPPGGSAEQRRVELKFWRARLDEYREQVVELIAADPAAAAARFTRDTERCGRCRSIHHAEDLPASAAADGRSRSLLTVEERDAIVVDLRRAGHPEALIAKALGIGTKTVNLAARRAGIGAPLRARDAGAAVMTDRDNAGRDNTGETAVPVTVASTGRRR